MSDAIDVESYRKRLVAERESLTSDSATTADSRAPVTLDQQSVGRLSRMDALQAQAMAHAQEERRRIRVRLIDGALQRVESGDYGYCVECGEDISPRRLDVDPATARCVDCAR